MKNFKVKIFIQALNQTSNASLSEIDSTIHDQFKQIINSMTSEVTNHCEN